MDQETTDHGLLTRFIGRDQDAFRHLVERHWALVCATSRRCGAPEIEDAAQAVFLVLAAQAQRLTGRRDLSGFLHETAQRVAWQQRRSAQARNRREAAAASPQEAPMADPDAAEAVEAALRRLPDGERSVILLRYIEDLPEATIATRLGQSVGAVSMRLSRARARLRRILGDPAVAGLEGGALGAALLPLRDEVARELSAQATLVAAGTTGTGPAALLAEATQRAMAQAKARLAAGLATAGLALGGGLLAILLHAPTAMATATEVQSAETPPVVPQPAVAPEPDWIATAAIDGLPGGWLTMSRRFGFVVEMGGMEGSAPVTIGRLTGAPPGLPDAMERMPSSSPSVRLAAVPAQAAAIAEQETWVVWRGPAPGADGLNTPYRLNRAGDVFTLVLDTYGDSQDRSAGPERSGWGIALGRLPEGRYELRVIERGFGRSAADRTRWSPQSMRWGEKSFTVGAAVPSADAPTPLDLKPASPASAGLFSVVRGGRLIPLVTHARIAATAGTNFGARDFAGLDLAAWLSRPDAEPPAGQGDRAIVIRLPPGDPRMLTWTFQDAFWVEDTLKVRLVGWRQVRPDQAGDWALEQPVVAVRVPDALGGRPIPLSVNINILEWREDLHGYASILEFGSHTLEPLLTDRHWIPCLVPVDLDEFLPQSEVEDAPRLH